MAKHCIIGTILYKKRYMIAFLRDEMLGPLPQHFFPKKSIM